jgi:hypothetical protein
MILFLISRTQSKNVSQISWNTRISLILNYNLVNFSHPSSISSLTGTFLVLIIFWMEQVWLVRKVRGCIIVINFNFINLFGS